MTTTIQRAAQHIDATDLVDGRWAHYADETSRWHVVSAEALGELCEYLDSDDPQVSGDAYSHWCAGTNSEEMPEGWNPNQSVFTYTIFDGNPAISGPCSWPTHERKTIVAESQQAALAAVLAIAKSEGEACGAYEPGFRVYVLVWDESGVNLQGSVELEGDGNDDDSAQ